MSGSEIKTAVLGVKGEGVHSSEEYIRMAFKKNFNVIKTSPAARNYEEANEFVQLAENQGVNFTVINPARSLESFVRLRSAVQSGLIDHPFMIKIECEVRSADQHPWQKDPRLAGGGVMLYECHDLVDQLVANFGVPQQVYSLNTGIAGDRQQRLSMTEDISYVMMKFSDSLIGLISATRTHGPEKKLLRIYGADKILTVTGDRFVLSDSGGNELESVSAEVPGKECIRRQLENFAVIIESPQSNVPISSSLENLRHAALVESAYLSARTGMPEEPGRMLKL